METLWTGCISGEAGPVVKDIELSSSSKADSVISRDAVLRLSSVVEVDRIPAYLVIGSSFHVNTTNPETEAWFSKYLLALSEESEAGSESRWWQTARPNSSLGILISVDDKVPSHLSRYPKVTELIFYADRTTYACERPPTPPLIPHVPSEENGKLSALTVHALALSSDLLCRIHEVTPPSSPGATKLDEDAVFLSPLASTASDFINEPPVRKRKSASDAFDEATERRKKVRCKGAAGVAPAAAVKNEHVLSSLKHRRSVSGSGSQVVPVQKRPLSRASSITSSRPMTARPPSEVPKRTSLLRAQSMPEPAKIDSIESKNKEAISRIVMAGMRLYGLAQSKSRKSRCGSSVASPALDESFEQQENDRQMDEEYKLVYHSVFKGTCFALRRHISTMNLQAHTEALREITDRLLSLYCADPLTADLTDVVDSLTPGGRKAFGSAVRGDTELGHDLTADLEVG